MRLILSKLRFAAVVCAATAAMGALTGCDTLDSLNPFGSASDPKLQGTRVPVLQLDQKIQPDPSVLALAVTAPPPVTNANWPVAGGNPAHSLSDLGLSGNLDRIWRASIGDGSSNGVKLLAQPVIAANTVFTLDASAQVTATAAQSGDRKWRVTISPEEAREETLGGGVGFGDGRLYASAGFPEIVALDPETGKVLWRHKTNAPTRGSPLYSDGRVFVLTIDNELTALKAATGDEDWTHNGVPETEAFLSDTGPAADSTVVVVPYSSGEVFALRVETGRVAWSDNLSAVRRASALWSLTDFNAMPVIDNGKVYAVSVSGRLVAIDERTGTRIWQHEIGSSSTPWVSGDFIYMINPDDQLICISTANGGIRWVVQLERYENPEKRTHPIFWTGPMVANGKLIMANSASQLVEFSLANGAVLQATELPDPVFVQPIVANNTLYIVTDTGDLLAYH